MSQVSTLFLSECSRGTCTDFWLLLFMGEMELTLDTLLHTVEDRYAIITSKFGFRVSCNSFCANFSICAFRWYYTSDHFVKEVSIEEVLASPAYMLFYDRSQSRV